MVKAAQSGMQIQPGVKDHQRTASMIHPRITPIKMA